MNKTIVSIVGIMVLLALLFFLGARSKEATPKQTLGAAAALSVSEPSFDFGTISMKEGKVRHTFTLQNTSTTTPLLVTRVSTSCMCTEAFLATPSGRLGPFGMPGHGGNAPELTETIPPGESRELGVIFDPAAHGPAGVGRISRSVFIEEGSGSSRALDIQALVTP